MHIIMLSSCHGCGDGFAARYFEQGRLYDVGDMLARYFIRHGFAIEPGIIAPHDART